MFQVAIRDLASACTVIKALQKWTEKCYCCSISGTVKPLFSEILIDQNHWYGPYFFATFCYSKTSFQCKLLGTTKFFIWCNIFFYHLLVYVLRLGTFKYSTFLGNQSIVWIFGNRLTPSSTFPLTIRWSESFPWKSQWRIWFFGIASPSTWGNVHQYQGQSRGLSGENLL